MENVLISSLSPLTKMSWADINELESNHEQLTNQYSNNQNVETPATIVDTENLTSSSFQSSDSNNVTKSPVECNNMVLQPQVCLYFKKGICVFGDKCDFLHDNESKEIPECKYNPCMFGKKCIYKHSKQLKQKKSNKRLEFKGNDSDFITHSINNTDNNNSNVSLTKQISKVKSIQLQPQKNKTPTKIVTKTKPTVEMCEECGEFLVNDDKCQSCC